MLQSIYLGIEFDQLERLKVKDMRFKSRQRNRVLRASLLGYVRAISKFKLDEGGIRDRSLQPAYASQELCQYGFPFAVNRRGQAEFHCLWYGFQANADGNAAGVLAERFGDAELDARSLRKCGDSFGRTVHAHSPGFP